MVRFDDLEALESMPVPATKRELLERMPPARAVLIAAFAGVPTAELVAPGFEEWSIKDHLWHIVAWQRLIIAHLRDDSDHAEAGMERAAYAAATLQQLNDHLHTRYREHSWPELVEALPATYGDLTHFIGEMTETALHQPYWSDEPNGRTAMEKITGDSYRHDLEHRRFILEMRARRR